MFFRAIRFVATASLLLPVASSCQTMSLPANAPAAATVSWPTVDGSVTLPSFRFGSGETLPELKLHYLTLGTPHRNGAGHVDVYKRQKLRLPLSTLTATSPCSSMLFETSVGNGPEFPMHVVHP